MNSTSLPRESLNNSTISSSGLGNVVALPLSPLRLVLAIIGAAAGNSGSYQCRGVGLDGGVASDEIEVIVGKSSLCDCGVVLCYLCLPHLPTTGKKVEFSEMRYRKI